MKKRFSADRRDFLKNMTMAAAGTALTAGAVPLTARAATAGWVNRTPINPAISNLRVVCCYDPTMTTGNYTRNTMAAQNAPVVTKRVQLNLDEMAKSLAQKTTAAEAWTTIFQKPAGKEFSAAIVAIKLNCKTNGGAPNGSPMNNPRIAVVDKICKELNNVGVPFANITLYDATDAEDASTLYGSFIGNGIPAGVKVSTTTGAMRTKINALVPAPKAGNYPCVSELVNNVVDILINITINKSHSYPHTALFSMTMKNHLGTFQPTPHETDYLIAINKSDAILGGTPPRQQLCIVDSLWSNMSGGPTSAIDARPNRLIMGTFGPALDYLTAKNVREAVMHATCDDTILPRFLTDFGYQVSEVANTFIDVPPAPITGTTSPRGQQRRGAALVVYCQGSSNVPLQFTLDPVTEAGTVFVSIADLKGRTVRDLVVTPQSDGKFAAQWDGRGDEGWRAANGTYVVKVRQNGRLQTRRFAVMK